MRLSSEAEGNRASRPTRGSRATPEQRRQLGRAIALWVGVTLAGVTAIGLLAIWHIRRRGRLLRERLGPPREVQWPDLDRPEGVVKEHEPGEPKRSE